MMRSKRCRNTPSSDDDLRPWKRLRSGQVSTPEPASPLSPANRCMMSQKAENVASATAALQQVMSESNPGISGALSTVVDAISNSPEGSADAADFGVCEQSRLADVNRHIEQLEEELKTAETEVQAAIVHFRELFHSRKQSSLSPSNRGSASPTSDRPDTPALCCLTDVETRAETPRTPIESVTRECRVDENLRLASERVFEGHRVVLDLKGLISEKREELRRVQTRSPFGTAVSAYVRLMTRKVCRQPVWAANSDRYLECKTRLNNDWSHPDVRRAGLQTQVDKLEKAELECKLIVAETAELFFNPPQGDLVPPSPRPPNPLAVPTPRNVLVPPPPPPPPNPLAMPPPRTV